jgi:hypothetical protein
MGRPDFPRSIADFQQRFPAEVSVIVSCHGLPDGPVRDAVLRAVAP